MNYVPVLTPYRIFEVDEHQADLLGRFADTPGDDAYTVIMTRGRLASAKNTDPQIRLWSADPSCSGNSEQNNPCRAPGVQYTLGGLATVNQSFLSQLPVGFSTGLLRQFSPGISSNAYLENITTEVFSRSCGNTTDSLYLRYQDSTSDIKFDFEVCMPGNMTQSPWRAQRTRQDFREDLLLKANLSRSSQGHFESDIYVRNVSLTTVAGYFELPNYRNGEFAGPLLEPDLDPTEECEEEVFGCVGQINSGTSHARRGTSNVTNAKTILTKNTHKGPLLTIALALFGPGSFFNTTLKDHDFVNIGQGQCTQVLPMTHLFRSSDAGQDGSLSDLDPCIRKTKVDKSVSLQWQYIRSFFENTHGQERIVNAFNAAAFLTHDVVMMCNPSKSVWRVHYDPGTSMAITIPEISIPSMWFISTHLSVYLGCLVILAVYNANTPRWTPQLDSFAMMRIGASMADKFPLQLAPDVEAVEELDKCDGWVGDGTEDDKEAEGDGASGAVNPTEPGTLKLGANTPLRRDRKYESYSSEESPWYHWSGIVRICGKDSKGVKNDEHIPLQNTGDRGESAASS